MLYCDGWQDSAQKRLTLDGTSGRTERHWAITLCLKEHLCSDRIMNTLSLWGVKFTTWAKSVVGRYVAYVYLGFLGLEKQMSNPEVKGDLILYPRFKGQFVL